MSKRPTDDLEPAAKKRGSSRQLTKDDPSDDEELDRGVPETASEEVLQKRRIVKARRTGSGAPPPTPTAGAAPATASANPFAGISILGNLESVAKQQAAEPSSNPEAATLTAVGSPSDLGTAEVRAPSTGSTRPDATAAATATAAEAAPPDQEAATQPEAADKKAQESQGFQSGASGFASLAASTAPFAAASTGKAAGFGSLANGVSNGDTNGSAAGPGSSGANKPFAFGSSSAAFNFQPKEGGFPAVASIFGSHSQTGGAQLSEADNIKPALAVLPPELDTVTGEEDEQVLWSGEGTLYEFDKAWKERGRGELRINRAPGRPARFVMRQRGHHRLLMNANLWTDMKVTPMDGGKGAQFPVVNAVSTSEEAAKPNLQTFAFRLKAASSLNAFIAAIEENKALQKQANLVQRSLQQL